MIVGRGNFRFGGLVFAGVSLFALSVAVAQDMSNTASPQILDQQGDNSPSVVNDPAADELTTQSDGNATEPTVSSVAGEGSSSATVPSAYLTGENRVSDEAVMRILSSTESLLSAYPSGGVPMILYVSRLAGSDNRAVPALVGLAQGDAVTTDQIAAIGAGLAAAASAPGASDNGYDAYIARLVAESQSPGLIAAYEAGLAQESTAALGAGGAGAGAGGGGTGGGVGATTGNALTGGAAGGGFESAGSATTDTGSGSFSVGDVGSVSFNGGSVVSAVSPN